jgi:hypothetical protein
MLGSPPAALGARNIGVRSEFQALPEAEAGEADQNKPADDDEGMQHGGWSARSRVGFTSYKSEPKRDRTIDKPKDKAGLE